MITQQHKYIWILISGSIVLLLSFILILSPREENNDFDGELTYADVKYQLELGPRIPGSDAHIKTGEWIVDKLKKFRWDVETQETTISGINIKNIIAKRGSGTPWVIIGSHYDSRKFADNDPTMEERQNPVPGANDGASSTAILLELGRILPIKPNKQIWLVFFDAEDISGNAIALGSHYFVSQMVGNPDSVVILDMVGDKDLNIYMEGNSNPELNKEIWDIATVLGHSQFIPSYKYTILDDHVPFVNAGIKAVDIIDFDYPYWHTTEDTLDKISAESLEIVGETVTRWLDVFP
jgi:glutaminyl-peptide cyclotransferase